jgi:hypothetical protein
MNFQIKPSEFLSEIGWKFQLRGNWLCLKKCPFCGGGQNADPFTFAVHAIDGNYFCHRAKCGAKGSFWGLIESQDRDPKDYLGERETTKKKRYIYGR